MFSAIIEASKTKIYVFFSSIIYEYNLEKQKKLLFFAEH